ncbi:hypothetical protein NHX12_032708 [Muraenolepis orangiensis]|uniref:Phosphoinositide 3-kinase regulatory subunit 5 n=1 Tax=Muraenolepis orangiensis TaxID=630683 RepID=A0A9Q0E9H4_9TELE|nr:hypothetical protein NHX12_032708 [Muraenolepis orangiensis]
MDRSSCTEDRIDHALQQCLAGLRPDAPNKKFWNEGLYLNRWCLEELLRREERNSIILLQLILTKTEEVLESSQYELVVPLTLLFSSTLLKTPHWVPEGSVLQEAYSLFHSFLSWPQPCSSASKHLLTVISQELRAPGISFQRLFRAVTDQLRRVQLSPRAITIRLVSHAVLASLGNASYTPQALHAALETARRELLRRMDRLAQRLGLFSTQANGGDGSSDIRPGRAEKVKSSRLSTRDGDEGTGDLIEMPFAKCHVCPWEKDNFDHLSTILANEIHHDLAPDCTYEDAPPRSFASVSWSSQDMLSCHSLSSSWSGPSRSPRMSGVDSDLAEELAVETDDVTTTAGAFSPDKGATAGGTPRFNRSRSLPRQVGVPHGSPDPLVGERPVCVRRRPILSCNEAEGEEKATMALVRVVVMGGDRELGRLARAYSRLQRTERRSPRITRRCRLQFFFVPAKRTAGEGPAPSEPQTGSPLKATPTSEPDRGAQPEVSTDIAHLLALMDPWYQRSVLSLLSLSSQVLHQMTCKANDDVTGSTSSSSSQVDHLPLLADLILYYIRHAHQPALLQLYQAELTLAGGGRIREVFIYSLELGHTAGTRAVRAMGAASKRFGIDGDREAVPLTLDVAYSQVSVGGRSQWKEAGEVACTSVNLHKACRRAQLVGMWM